MNGLGRFLEIVPVDLGVCRLALYPCDQMSEATTVSESQEAKDRAVTLRNRARLSANKNLLFWYRELYRDQFKDFSESRGAVDTRNRKRHVAAETISLKRGDK